MHQESNEGMAEICIRQCVVGVVRIVRGTIDARQTRATSRTMRRTEQGGDEMRDRKERIEDLDPCPFPPPAGVVTFSS